MSPAEIRSRFQDLGWEIQSGGKRDFAVRGKKKIRLPNPHGSDVSVELIRRIIRDAGIDRDTWLA